MNEIGFILCRTRRGRTRAGPICIGDRTSVNVPVKCPAGSRPEALWHTHPSGSLTLSGQDIQTGQNHGIPHVCVSDGHKGSTKCYKVTRRR